MQYIFWLPLILLFSETCFGFDQSHSKLKLVLQNYVTVTEHESSVNYAALKAHPEELTMYLAEVEKVTATEFSAMTEEQRLSFLINAYNAETLRLVIDHFPIKSIKDVGGLFSSPWKIKFFNLFGESHNLDEVEHQMIREKFNEPRIHFALVCASKGCPRLLNAPYLAATLNAQLENSTVAFLGDSNRNQYSSKTNTFEVSSIFKWYAEDFVKKSGSVQKFLAATMPLKVKPSERAIQNAQIKYLDYDWSLNGK